MACHVSATDIDEGSPRAPGAAAISEGSMAGPYPSDAASQPSGSARASSETVPSTQPCCIIVRTISAMEAPGRGKPPAAAR